VRAVSVRKAVEMNGRRKLWMDRVHEMKRMNFESLEIKSVKIIETVNKKKERKKK